MTIQFKTTKSLEEQLNARSGEGTSTSQIAKRDLSRFYEMIEEYLFFVNLDEAEAQLFSYVLPTEYTISTIHFLEYDILSEYEAKKDTLYCGIDEKTFVPKVKSLSFMQKLAICDAVERYRIMVDEKGTNILESLYRSGLVKKQ